MKHNKSQAARSGHENKTSSNELDEQNTNAAKVTAPVNEEYSDSIDNCQEELQQVGLLASELVDSKGNNLTITSRLSTFVPNILVRSHHKKTSDSYRVSSEKRNASTATGAMKKMTRNGESINTAHSGDAIGLESNEKAANKCSRKAICCIFLSMALCIGLVLAVFLVFSPKVLDQGDKCYHGNKAFQNYNLFSTKTLYSTAINYLDGSTPKPAGSTLDIYVSSSVIKPEIFSAGQTLKGLHNHLTTSEGCKVRQFHFYGRHAARSPDSEDIDKLNNHIKNLKARIIVGRYATAAALQQPIGQATSESPSVDVLKEERVNMSSTICQDPLEEIARWDNYMNPEGGNLVTEFGYQESAALAKRFKDIYPDLFNGSKASIQFATTNEIRTAQTAISFLNQMSNPPDVGCPLSSFPKPINMDLAQAQAISSDPCFKKFLTNHYNENLKFHKTCKARARNVYDNNLGLSSTSFYQNIADNLATELTGHNRDKFGPDDAKVIYEICRYETALFGKPSVWCRFFKEKDLIFMDYVTDVGDFWGEAYGLSEYARSSCFVTKDMIELINQYAAKRTPKPEARFFFSHSTAIQKLIAATIDLQNDDAYQKAATMTAMKTGDVPLRRSWRTSLLTPFSANIAFTLYDCDKTANASTSGQGVVREIDLNSIKIVASLNEQPIKMEGCDDYACDYLSFKRSRVFKNADSSGCEYTKLCQATINVT